MSDEPEHLDLRSHDLAADKRAELLSLFPEVTTEGGQIDFDRLRLALGEMVDVGKERYGLTWPGKADCFRAIQTPTLATLRPCPEESVNFERTEHLIIEGDNLEVLKLLQKSYLGRVKMIYIDPPYNTGNDFIYPDDYADSLRNYLAYTGQVDAAGRAFSTNTEADGRFHSKWLNMMYPRLYLARSLLREDGAMCVSIGEEELPSLRLLMNDVFGEENYRNTILVRRFDKNLNRQFMDSGLATLNVGAEYILVYSRSCELSFNPVFRPASEERQATGYWKGFWNAAERPTMRYPLLGVEPESGQWKWKQSVACEAVANYEEFLAHHSEQMTLEEYWASTGRSHRYIRRNPQGRGKNLGVENWIPPSEGILRSSNWTDLIASETLADGGLCFDNPKNMRVIQELLRLAADADDLILDFFAGSGTTAHAVVDLNRQDGGNRKLILVQLPEPTGRDDYPTIADITKERVRRAIGQLTPPAEADQASLFDDDPAAAPDLGFRVFKLAESNFTTWDADAATDEASLARQLELHIDHVREGRTEQDLLFEILLKEGFALTAPVETLTLAGKRVYSVADGGLLLCLERDLTLELVRAIADRAPQRVVCLDEGFTGHDQLKANAVQIFRSQGVVRFKTV